MGIFNQMDGISDTFLKTKKFRRGNWGAPNYYTENKKNKNKPNREYRTPHWDKEHQIFERFFDNYYIYYFPTYFKGYVNIDRKNIQDHAGYIVGIGVYSDGYEYVKVNDEADFNMALELFKRRFNKR